MELWVQIVIGAITAAAAAGLAYLGAIAGARATRDAARTAAQSNQEAIEQRELAGRREEWGRRFTLAAELVVRDEPAAEQLGIALLRALGESELAGPDEERLIRAAVAPLARQATAEDTEGERPLYAVDGGDDDERTSP